MSRRHFNFNFNRLAKYDLVVTTYGTAQTEITKVIPDENSKKSLDNLRPVDLDKIDGKNVPLLTIAWERIILDEAHTIRNPRAKTSIAIGNLRAAKRWAVTGTPIHNKDLDMYALIRFLRCSPFDEYAVWKQWVDKSPVGQQRMNTLVKSLLLRRTKDQKSNVTGKEIVSLPPKTIVEHKMALDKEERKVYDEVFSFSQQAMINYMMKHKEHEDDMAYIKQVEESGYRFNPSQRFGEAEEDAENRPAAANSLGSSSSSTATSKLTARNFAGNSGKEVKTHHLLVLLLRLRQICNHPGLIKSMLDEESKANEGIVTEDNTDDMDLVAQMESMSLSKKTAPQMPGEDPEDTMKDRVLDLTNPVFKEKRASSKINTVIEKLIELKKKQRDTGVMEKAVVVSQWTSMLNIVKVHVKEVGLKVAEINGSIPVKLRGDIVNDFNKKDAGAQVMLLSLAAGGVGLNLVGANHLFLIDLHWNPQLEAQVCP